MFPKFKIFLELDASKHNSAKARLAAMAKKYVAKLKVFDAPPSLTKPKIDVGIIKTPVIRKIIQELFLITFENLRAKFPESRDTNWAATQPINRADGNRISGINILRARSIE